MKQLLECIELYRFMILYTTLTGHLTLYIQTIRPHIQEYPRFTVLSTRSNKLSSVLNSHDIQRGFPRDQHSIV